MLPDPVRALLASQADVATRSQLAGLGVAPHDLAIPRAGRTRTRAAATPATGPRTASGRRVCRDADYGLLLVELDGRLHHDSAAARDRDLERDLDAAVAGQRTVRLSWGQVYGRPCSSAAKLAALLTRLGWEGSPHPCGPACALAGPSARAS